MGCCCSKALPDPPQPKIKFRWNSKFLSYENLEIDKNVLRSAKNKTLAARMPQDGSGGCSVTPPVHAEMPKKEWTFRVHISAENSKPHEVYIGFAHKES